MRGVSFCLLHTSLAPSETLRHGRVIGYENPGQERSACNMKCWRPHTLSADKEIIALNCQVIKIDQRQEMQHQRLLNLNNN